MQAIPKMVGDGMSYSGTSSANWQRIDPCVSGSLKKGAIAKVDQASKVSMGIVGFFCLKSASRKVYFLTPPPNLGLTCLFLCKLQD